MKTYRFISLVLAIFVAVFFSSCKKEPIAPIANASSANTSSAASDNLNAKTASCGFIDASLVADEGLSVGSVIVRSNNKSLIVTYKVASNFNINEVRFYIGDYRLLPQTQTGNLIPGQFPYFAVMHESTNEYTLTIPLSTVQSCFVVSALASVSQRANHGYVARPQIVWAKGGDGTKNYFHACMQSCAPDAE